MGPAGSLSTRTMGVPSVVMADTKKTRAARAREAAMHEINFARHRAVSALAEHPKIFVDKSRASYEAVLHEPAAPGPRPGSYRAPRAQAPRQTRAPPDVAPYAHARRSAGPGPEPPFAVRCDFARLRA